MDAAEGRTDLIRSSEASRSSFRLRSLPIAPELVSVVSWAMTRTGVGVAVLAVFGLNRSYCVSFDLFSTSASLGVDSQSWSR